MHPSAMAGKRVITDPALLEPWMCGRNKTASEGLCTRPKIKGGDVCPAHGGSIGRVKAAAQRNLLAGELRSMLERHGRDVPITDPLSALQEHAGKVRSWFDFLEDRISSLRHSSQWDTEQIRGEVELFTRAQETVGKILVDMAKLKIDERLVAIEEGKVQMLFDALKAGLVAGGVTGPGPTQAAFAAAGKRLRLIPGGKADDQGQTRKAAGY
jgi:hypothetical protein